MPDLPSDTAIPVDGTVGSLEPLEEAAPIARRESSVHFFVSGDEVTDARAMGLAEDLRLLVQGFMSGPADERENTPPTLPYPKHRDLEIALHGLQLDPDEEAELRHRVARLMQDRMGEGVTEQ